MTNTHVPNQRQITICKADNYPDGKFFKANKEYMFSAMQNLSASGLKLYLYLLSNKAQYTFFLSAADVKNKTGLSMRSYYTAANELIEQNFLVQQGSSLNYLFFETPKKEKKEEKNA